MDNFEVRLANILDFMELYGSGGFDDAQIEELENIIMECQSRHQNDYTNGVADAIYDTLYDMLKEVKPESHIFAEIWEESEQESGSQDSEYTDLLRKHPMMSIETAKSFSCKELENWVNRMPEECVSYFASYKINGHGIRVVYDDGHLVSATSRARASAGRDLTRQARIMLGEYKEELKGMGVVELRGEACLRLDLLDKAREFNPSIKSAFSAVSSLIKPSATEEEVSLLSFLCYGLLTDDEDFDFPTREEEFMAIQEFGFETPQYMLIEEASREDLLSVLKDILEAMEEGYEEFGYFCDGFVVEVNDRETFRDLGSEGNHNLGNIAMKVGIWKQDIYVGYVQTIQWTKGKSKLSPVAIVGSVPDVAEFDEDGGISNMEDFGVLTAQGNTVRRVPLYEPKNILILNAYVGEILCFRYGGEAGVVPCFEDGRLLTEDAVKDRLEDN